MIAYNSRLLHVYVSWLIGETLGAMVADAAFPIETESKRITVACCIYIGHHIVGQVLALRFYSLLPPGSSPLHARKPES